MIGRGRRRGVGRLGAVAALALTALALAVLAACGGPRSGLGTNASACFRALPAAQEAVHDQGKLVGVRIVSDEHAREIVPYTGREDEEHHVCLVAYRGRYAADGVDLVVHRDGDTFAVVAVLLDARPEELGAIVVDKLPARFRHL